MNNLYFHRVVLKRTHHNRIVSLKDVYGNNIHHQANIVNEFVNYFQNNPLVLTMRGHP
jgi:hypothetical protein